MQAMALNNFEDAVQLFTKAINKAPKDHELFCDRSAAYAKAGQYELALEDANQTINLEQTPKGFSRKWEALLGFKNYREAYVAFKKAFDLDPKDSTLKKTVHDVSFLSRGVPMDEDSDSISPESTPPKPKKMRNRPKTKTSKKAVDRKFYSS